MLDCQNTFVEIRRLNLALNTARTCKRKEKCVCLEKRESISVLFIKNRIDKLSHVTVSHCFVMVCQESTV